MNPAVIDTLKQGYFSTSNNAGSHVLGDFPLIGEVRHMSIPLLALAATGVRPLSPLSSEQSYDEASPLGPLRSGPVQGRQEECPTRIFGERFCWRVSRASQHSRNTFERHPEVIQSHDGDLLHPYRVSSSLLSVRQVGIDPQSLVLISGSSDLRQSNLSGGGNVFSVMDVHDSDG
jgi:hypothetical protein